MIYSTLSNWATEATNKLFPDIVQGGELQVQRTHKGFRGDYTLVLFPLVKTTRTQPEKLGELIGNKLMEMKPDFLAGFEVVKGFLNVRLSDSFWAEFFTTALKESSFGFFQNVSETPVLVEFSSPNTNKPLHLGHIRNNLLGDSISRLLEASGKRVLRLNLVNDRGIHICKSMLAWKRWGNGETPESSGIKGDRLVGKYYVLFDKKYREEIAILTQQGFEVAEAEKQSELMAEAREMLRMWEQNDPGVTSLWRTMNQWVYDGFDKTYADLGIRFDNTDYESETYLFGKRIIMEGLELGKLYSAADGSVWANLAERGLDQKLLLRSDGTSVYMTQDIGTACQRYTRYSPEKMIYVVGNEQNYHFEALREVLLLLQYSWATAIQHLSYGMVELPEGRMKSREGTVVDADDLIQAMIETARKITMELGKAEGFNELDREQLFKMLGLGALKYYILKVDPKKTMLFNPEESIDFNGNTGPFIQYTHARICSVQRKAVETGKAWDSNGYIHKVHTIPSKERELLQIVYDFPLVVKQAADELNPALLANHLFELAKEYNQFYQEFPVLKEPDLALSRFRLGLTYLVGTVLQKGMGLLGIDVPEKM